MKFGDFSEPFIRNLDTKFLVSSLVLRGVSRASVSGILLVHLRGFFSGIIPCSTDV